MGACALAIVARTGSCDDGRMALPVPPDGPALAQWRFEPLTVFLVLAAGSLYAAAVHRVRPARPWSSARTAAWFGGLGVLTVALLSPVDAYAEVSFSTHMAQHLLLTIPAPILLALGAPATLALRALRLPAARRLASALRSRPVAILTHPAVGFAVFVSVSFAVHFTPLFDAALRSQAWHAAEHALWVTAALIYWWPIVGVDPTPHPVPYPARLLSLTLAMPATSFLALGIYGASRPLYATYAALPPPWGAAALSSQRDAAVMMWLLGNLAMVVAMLFVAAAWKRADDVRQEREDARLDGLERAVG
jgi:cytochrome c oxidase assembly factor CtaG